MRVAATPADRFFARFPAIRLATIELGSDWAFHLFTKLKKSFGQTPQAYPEDPRDTFRNHVWVSPYYEDDLAASRRWWAGKIVMRQATGPTPRGWPNPPATSTICAGPATPTTRPSWSCARTGWA